MDQEKVWDAIAGEWFKVRNKFYKPAEVFLKDVSKTSKKILDFGCGSGRNFMKLKNSKMYGLDFSQKMIQLARENARAHGDYVELRKIDNEKIPFNEGFFDSAICVASIHCIEKPERRKKAIREIYRVLKKDSKAFFSVWSKKHKKIKKYGDNIIPWKIEGKSYDRFYYIYKKQEFLDLLDEVGFRIESVKEGDNIDVVVSK